MGTRHYQRVIAADGKTYIKQYGQWDGYPEGQGVEILRYLKKGNLKKYQENLVKIPKITKKQGEEVNSKGDKWSELYPYLSRDCGSKIHQMIEDGTVLFVGHTSKKEAREWCEGFYTIDFTNETFTTEWYGKVPICSLDDLPCEDSYIAYFKDDEEGEQ